MRWVAAMALVLAWCATTSAQSSRPATGPAVGRVPAGGSYEHLPLRRGSAAGGGTPPVRSAAASPALTYTRVVLALGVVIAVILALRWLSGKMMISPPGGGAQAVAVVSRLTLGPRQQLMLLHVGRRLVLVANCGGQMNTLCQIDDAEEVATLLAQVRAPRSEAGSAFRSLFGRAASQFEPPPAEPAATTADLMETRRELDGLMQTVKGLAKRMTS